jgi:ribosomal protein S18 acetylase RimI-like enzyme
MIRDATAADVSAIALIHVDALRDTYAGVVPDDYLRALTYRSRAAMWRRAIERARGFVLVADDGGGVLGFASGGSGRDVTIPFDGELYAIYLRPDRLRRGLGTALLRAAASRLAERGLTSMYAMVLAANPACRFYEALGGERFVRKTIEIGGAALDEVAYVWPELPSC